MRDDGTVESCGGFRREGGPQIGDGSELARSNVAGIILAGVHTWGDGVLERVACRPVLPIATRPLVWHVADWLRREGVAEAFVCGNSDTSVLRRILGSGEELDLDLVYYEDQMPRGPAGCARDAAVRSEAEAFVVVEGTIVPRIDLRGVLDTHMKSNAALTVVVAHMRPTNGHAIGATRCGNGIPETPVGIYVFSRSALMNVPATGYQDIKEKLIPRLHAQGQRVSLCTVPAGLAPRVTGAASYLAVNMWAVERMTREIIGSEGMVRAGQGWVHKTVSMASTTRLVGPVLIGRECVIGPGAMIVGPTAIGAHCTIEMDAVVSRSVLWDNCKIGQGAVVDHCIVTNAANIDAENAVRNTVCTVPAPAQRGLLNRIKALCRPVRKKPRVADRVDSAQSTPFDLPENR